ncbi:PREDICTED: arginine/serine-rich protein PNISR isoform X2 [Drosophila arizonae]|uniref:Arginine/serine-rich protein PNISR isoform X2 n=1 Tax=Drosophila arizonae TaxID=7263 RepID=A0ABM1Q2H5_DROAR|nr:PREDICTED: arginine/serine-rich protein PNISR isoform X2 [Drosophila arizonae]
MFPGGNTNADLGFNKHNQYMAQPPHFLVAPGPGSVPIPGAGLANPLAAATPVMPMNVQGGIDWAQLAQQWIHMRDSSAAQPMANFSMNMPIAPPPPIISNAPEYHHHQQQQLRQQQQQQQPPKVQKHYEEHGEAEMDMDMDEEENENSARMAHCIENLPPPPVVTQSQWLAGRVNDVPNIASHDTVGPDPQQWNDWSARNNPTAHIPSLLKLNVCNPNEPAVHQQAQLPLPKSSSSTVTGSASCSGVVSTDIDANKRKMLPAWIREGLEKMEREKQKQLERQATTTECETPEINVKQVSSKSLTTPVNLLNMSNVASDSEDSNAAPVEATLAPSLAQLIGNEVLSKASNSDDEQEDDEQQESQPQHDVDSGHVEATVARSANAEAALSGKNYEERLADLMLVVRRTLTEILLETTNEEIAAIATETLKAHRAKASSAQVIRKSALSSITGNLGLAVYGDSSSESDDDADDNEGGQTERGNDSSADKTNELSADELKARIRKSKRAFERVIDDIEERVLLQEQLDERKLQQHRKLELEQAEASRQRDNSEHRQTEASVDRAGHETKNASTNEKMQQFNGKRLSRKERTTRFSDNKDGKQAQTFVTQVVAVPAVQSTIIAQKLKPVPNPATNLLQMPESVTTMLSAADKALDKASKTGKKSKSRRRQSTSSSSSSNSGDSSSSSSSSSDSNSSSNSSKSSSNSEDSSTRSSAPAKKHGKSSRHQSRGSSGHKQKSEPDRKSHRRGPSTSSTRNYDRHRSSRESRDHRSSRDSRDHHSSRDSRDRDRTRDREHERRAMQYSRQNRERRRRRDSSQSGEENASSSYRHHSSRSHQSSSSYGKHRRRTRSRSNSRSTHNSHSSVSTSASHQLRKRK